MVNHYKNAAELSNAPLGSGVLSVKIRETGFDIKTKSV